MAAIVGVAARVLVRDKYTTARRVNRTTPLVAKLDAAPNRPAR